VDKGVGQNCGGEGLNWKPAIVVPEEKKAWRAFQRYLRRQIEPLVDAWDAISNMFRVD